MMYKPIEQVYEFFIRICMAYAQDLMYPAGLEVLNFGLSPHLHICSVYASSDGPGVSVQLC